MPTTHYRPEGGALIGGEADVAFVSGAPGQVDADIQVLWDFDNDGDFSEALEDITALVVAAESVTGRDWPSLLQGRAAPGTLTVTLDNTDDRFSHFNAASPLNQAPFSLGTGRKIRVQALGATNPDPVVLARDRFREDGAMTVDELGNTWTTQSSGLVKSGGRATFAPSALAGDESIRTVDVGTNDHYVQVTSEFLDSGNAADLSQTVSIVYRWQDAINYGEVIADEFSVKLRTVVDTVSTTIAEYAFEANNHHHLTFGVHAHGTTADLYVEGVLVGSGTAASFTGGVVGIKARLNQDYLRFPALEEFWVFDGVPVTTDDVVWTGDVASVVPNATIGSSKTATVTAEGRLARAANVEVEISGSAGSVAGSDVGPRTGIAVGHTLNRAGLATPPGFIDEGDIQTGGYGFPKGGALELARGFEEAELGFLFEAPEGYLSFASRSARDVEPVAAGFSDTPGAQFGYSELTLLDWRKEVINQVSAGLAPRGVTGTRSGTGASQAAGVDNNITFGNVVVMTPGDLLVMFIAATVRPVDRRWAAPQGWTALRDPGDQSQGFTLGVYYKIAGPNDAGQSMTFLNDASTGGVWQVNAYRIFEWFGTAQGIEIGTPISAVKSWGDDASVASTPPPIAPSWGVQFPTFFISAYAGWTSATGGIDWQDPKPPSGYTAMTSTVRTGTIDGFDVALGTAARTAPIEVEAPGPWVPIEDAEFTQSIMVAVRGRNSRLPVELTTGTVDLASKATGFDSIVGNDFASQDAHGGVRTHRGAANLFRDEDDANAYNALILDRYADDRPIFAMSFWATTNAGYRAQALARRVGHKIVLTADGDTGMGVQGAFFIEKVVHNWSSGAKVWKTTWELSPA